MKSILGDAIQSLKCM